MKLTLAIIILFLFGCGRQPKDVEKAFVRNQTLHVEYFPMDSRLRKLKIKFPSHWEDISTENPAGPPTFINGRLDEPGVLQISLAEYSRGERPNADYKDLLQLSESIGMQQDFGEIRKRESGNCEFGKYAYVQFSRPDFPYITVWHLTNGKDYIFSTFICSRVPDDKEETEVKSILTTIKKKTFVF